MRDTPSGRGGVGGTVGGGAGLGGTPMAGMATPASGRPGLLTPGGMATRETGGGGGRGGGNGLSGEVKAVSVSCKHVQKHVAIYCRYSLCVLCLLKYGWHVLDWTKCYQVQFPHKVQDSIASYARDWLILCREAKNTGLLGALIHFSY